MKLLTRQEFKTQVFQRDKGCCLFCEKAAEDAHHIIDRSLFADGGYYLDNGASVCQEHHLQCERTDISVEDIRKKANITNLALPDEFETDIKFDKWGNVVLENGQRLKGPLFEQENVQRVLKDKMHLFVDYVKYPRTFHLPWSEGKSDDDKTLKKVPFDGKEVVVTLKMDGENTTLYSDYIHARSLDSRNHPSRNWVKNFWGQIKYNIPEKYRICGESLYAVHSIEYKNLDSYFMGFSIWNDKNICLSWKDTTEWFELLGIQPVEVIYQGPYDEEKIKAAFIPYKETHEGYVIRNAASFPFKDFLSNVAKCVRENHVQTESHWMEQTVKPNGLKKTKVSP